jgi:hypothetical protein
VRTLQQLLHALWFQAQDQFGLQTAAAQIAVNQETGSSTFVVGEANSSALRGARRDSWTGAVGLVCV